MLLFLWSHSKTRHTFEHTDASEAREEEKICYKREK